MKKFIIQHVMHGAQALLCDAAVAELTVTYEYQLGCDGTDKVRNFQGCYSETGFHIGLDRNFVCLWRRHNCN
jgi:hypothetical protein